jgi:hypothetical protein
VSNDLPVPNIAVRRVGGVRVLGALVAALALSGVAGATSPPVGRIPIGPVSTIATQRGQLVAVALPHAAGTSWRIARALNPKVLREVDEADVGANVVIVFKAVGKGHATIVFARTRGETSHAYASRSFSVTVR